MKRKNYLSAMLLVMIAVLLPQSLIAQTIETHVTSFGKYNFSGKHFCILSNMENVPSDDVEFKEYAKYISYAFQMRGGVEVSPRSDEVEICILMSYDIKDASYTRTVSEPVWGQTNVSSVTTRTNMSGQTVYDYHYNYGVVNYRQSQQVVNSFNRYVDLFVYELSPDNKDVQKMVWKAYAKSNGSENNLYKMIPYMALTLYSYIGVTVEDGWWRLPQNEWQINEFKNGYYLKPNATYYPYIKSGWEVTNLSLGKDHFRIWLVYKQPDKTRVVFQVWWEKDYDNLFSFFDNTFVKYQGKEYRWRSATYLDGKKFKIGNRNYVSSRNKYCYLIIDFPPLPDDAYVIDLISQKKKGKTSKDDMVWKGIHLRNW